jgi:hypothetical protein
LDEHIHSHKRCLVERGFNYMLSHLEKMTLETECQRSALFKANTRTSTSLVERETKRVTMRAAPPQTTSSIGSSPE